METKCNCLLCRVNETMGNEVVNTPYVVTLKDGRITGVAPKLVYTIMVYLDDGNVFEYDVSDEEKIREHAAAIVKDGYRRVANSEFVHYPAHRIVKVKGVGPGITTKFPDRVRGV